jgi:hypothetical protein
MASMISLKAAVAHLERPTDTVELVLAALLILGLAEVGQHARVVPALEPCWRQPS